MFVRLRYLCAGTRTRRWFLAVFSLFWAGCFAARTDAAQSEDRSQGPSTTAAAKGDALEGIPFDKLDSEWIGPINGVIKDCSLFRRLPTQVIDCDPEMFTFLAQNPEVLVEIWRELGITQVSLERLDKQSFRFSDAVGTTGRLVIVDQQCQPGAQNRLVLFVEGAYEGKAFPNPLRAECVIVLQSGSIVESDGRTYVASRLDTFVHIDQASLELFAKLLQPLVGRTADRNFADTMKFVGNFSQAAEQEPHRIERLAGSLSKVTPSRRKQLSALAHQVHDQSQQSPKPLRTARQTSFLSAE